LTYRFRYRAKNVNGWGGYSPISYVEAATIPEPPQTPTYVSSSATEITVTVLRSLDNKGSPITHYTLYMDNGDLSDSFTEVERYDGSSATFTVTADDEGIVSGNKYRFVTTATNSIGDSLYSQESRFAAASLPAKPA